MRIMGISAVTLAGVIAGCEAPSTQPDGPPSGVMVTSEDRRALYVVSADDDLLARVRTEDRAVTTVDLPGEPTRLTRLGDRLFVTLRAQRSVAEVRDQGDRLELVRQVEVGAEPYGIAASRDGAHVYVAESLGGRVLELRADTLEPMRAFVIEGQPRWLAAHPGGRGLYVGALAPSALHFVDLTTGEVSAVAGASTTTAGQMTMPRITGDPAVSPDGARIVVPVLYAQPSLPVSRGTNSGGPGGYGATHGGEPIERFQAAAAIYDVDEVGRPGPATRVVRLRLPERGGYASRVRFSPGGDGLVACIEGGDVVVSAPLDERALLGLGDGFETRVLSVVQAPAGPRGLTFSHDGTPYTFGFLDRSVAALPTELLFGPEAHGGLERSRAVPSAAALITARQRPLQWELGRRLFYSTYDPRVSGPDLPASCATCHVDGRDDGLTWLFEDGPRQTPSLAGGASEREPVTWTGSVPTVAQDALSTGSDLMGGFLMSRLEASRIATFIESIRAVDPPLRAEDSWAVERGRALFERADVECSSCHAGPQLTDRQRHLVRGTSDFMTPGLRGVAATPPYMHDGSLGDLRAVVERASQDQHGQTSHLRGDELDDLVAYLRSL